VTPEQQARLTIDGQLAASGWVVQDMKQLNLHAGHGVAVREFPLLAGPTDYLLFFDGKAVGVVEAKKVGTALTGVELQVEKYREGVPKHLKAPRLPLPFGYESTGVETRFTSGLDFLERSRAVFAFHRPEQLAAWLDEAPAGGENRTFRNLVHHLPPLTGVGLRDCQFEAITNLERSLAADRPRALIQMATGSGKTYTAIGAVYRLLKHGGAKRVLFLVDRANLGRQALAEFQTFVTPDDGRKFTELYNVQHLRSNVLNTTAAVCITTIQRLFSILAGQPELDPALDETSLFELDGGGDYVREVRYNPNVPIEFFDALIVDECHRSIYNLWRGVLEYFDAALIGLTATPNKQTFGFFNQNLVMEYGHQRAVAEAVNVDYSTYRIKTAIGEGGGLLEAGEWVDKRDRQTRAKRWEELDEELAFAANDLNRAVVVPDQLRTVLRAVRDGLRVCFPDRTEVPKTLIFALDDAHADDVVQMVREVFDAGNEFAQKITYKTTGQKPEELIKAFRTGYYPRVAVTVDMIATGTDIRPLEALVFLRSVKSKGFFEQMKGRGTRVISDSDLQSVSPSATSKTGFVLFDAVGVTERIKTDEPPLERQKAVPFGKLLMNVALGDHRPDTLSTLAGRLGRLAGRTKPADALGIIEATGGKDLRALANDLLAALDPDRRLAGGAGRHGAGRPRRRGAGCRPRQARRGGGAAVQRAHGARRDRGGAAARRADDRGRAARPPAERRPRPGRGRAGTGGGRHVPAVHPRQPRRDRRAPGALRAGERAAEVARPEGAGADDRGPAARADDRSPLAGLRDAGGVAGARGGGAAAGDRSGGAGALRAGAGARRGRDADPLAGDRGGALRGVARRAGAAAWSAVHRRAGGVAGADPRPDRDLALDGEGRLRLRSVHRAWGAGQGAPALRGGVADDLTRVE